MVVQICVVCDEHIVVQHLLNDRMTSVLYVDDSICIDLRSNIPICNSHIWEWTQSIEHGYAVCCSLYPCEFCSKGVPELNICVVLQRNKLVGWSEYNSSQSVKLLGCVSLRIGKCLLSDEIIRHKTLIWIGYIKIISEHLIKLYLEILDSGLFLLSGLKLCDPVLAISCGILQSVYVLKIAIFEYSALSDKYRRLINYGTVKKVIEIL